MVTPPRPYGYTATPLTAISASDALGPLWGAAVKVRSPRSLNLPPQDAVERRLLHHLNARSRPIEPRHLYGPIADDFKLTVEQRSATPRKAIPIGTGSLSRPGGGSLRKDCSTTRAGDFGV